jgi:hypothetical protein
VKGWTTSPAFLPGLRPCSAEDGSLASESSSNWGYRLDCVERPVEIERVDSWFSEKAKLTARDVLRDQGQHLAEKFANQTDQLSRLLPQQWRANSTKSL